MFGLLGGFMITQALRTAARLRIADLVHDRPRTSAELAEASGADAVVLGRVLRALASVGVFSHEAGVVQQTELSEMLRSDVPGSVRSHAEMFGGMHFRAWSEADESFRTGEPVFERVFGLPFFDWLTEHPTESETFNKAMAASSTVRRVALLERNWSDVTTVVDVGGGTGTLLTSLLERESHLRGLVYDLPHLRDGAEATIEAASLGDRCSFQGGSFFEHVPAGADVYILSHILHDWGDEDALRILRSCAAAVDRESRLVLVEAIVEPGDEPDWTKLLDLHMLVVLGGRERSEDEWRRLLEHGGFELLRPVREAGLLEAVATIEPRSPQKGFDPDGV
jgi:hypothetical protein